MSSGCPPPLPPPSVLCRPEADRAKPPGGTRTHPPGPDLGIPARALRPALPGQLQHKRARPVPVPPPPLQPSPEARPRAAPQGLPKSPLLGPPWAPGRSRRVSAQDSRSGPQATRGPCSAPRRRARAALLQGSPGRVRAAALRMACSRRLRAAAVVVQSLLPRPPSRGARSAEAQVGTCPGQREPAHSPSERRADRWPAVRGKEVRKLLLELCVHPKEAPARS